MSSPKLLKNNKIQYGEKREKVNAEIAADIRAGKITARQVLEKRGKIARKSSGKSCAGNRPPCPASCDRVVRKVKAPGKAGRDGKKVKKAHCRARSELLKAWVKAAKQHGYLKKGENFKKMPKKGTDAYKAIKATYENMKKK